MRLTHFLLPTPRHRRFVETRKCFMLPWLRSSWPRSSRILRSCPAPGGRIRQGAHRHLRRFCPWRCLHSCKAALAMANQARGQGFRLVVFRGPQCQLAPSLPVCRTLSTPNEPDIFASAQNCRTLAVKRDCASTGPGTKPLHG